MPDWHTSQPCATGVPLGDVIAGRCPSGNPRRSLTSSTRTLLPRPLARRVLNVVAKNGENIMSIHTSVLFLHILAGAVLLGTSLLDVLLRGQLRGARDMASLERLTALLQRAARVSPAAPLVLLITGSYLASAGFWSAPWVWAAVVLFVVSSALAVGVVGREAGRLNAVAASAGQEPVTAEADLLRWSPRWEIAANVLLANDLVALFLMTNKPGLLGSIALPVLAALGAAAACRMRGPSRLSSAPALNRQA